MTMTNANAGYTPRRVCFGHSFAPGNGTKKLADVETATPNAQAAGAKKGAPTDAHGNRAAGGQSDQRRAEGGNEATRRHTQANYRAAKAQGRVRHPSYPASRVAGLKHEPKLTAEDAHEIRRT